jgi:hypothetical protein
MRTGRKRVILMRWLVLVRNEQCRRFECAGGECACARFIIGAADNHGVTPAQRQPFALGGINYSLICRFSNSLDHARSAASFQ